MAFRNLKFLNSLKGGLSSGQLTTYVKNYRQATSVASRCCVETELSWGELLTNPFQAGTITYPAATSLKSRSEIAYTYLLVGNKKNLASFYPHTSNPHVIISKPQLSVALHIYQKDIGIPMLASRGPKSWCLAMISGCLYPMDVQFLKRKKDIAQIYTYFLTR